MYCFNTNIIVGENNLQYIYINKKREIYICQNSARLRNRDLSVVFPMFVPQIFTRKISAYMYEKKKEKIYIYMYVCLYTCRHLHNTSNPKTQI